MTLAKVHVSLLTKITKRQHILNKYTNLIMPKISHAKVRI